MTGAFPAILAVAIADFRERSRRYSFWILLVFIAYATYLFIPSAGALYSTVRLGAYRGIYNSAWIGSQVTLMSVVLISLVGFYFIKGSVSREMRLKTQELVASSPISNLSYLAGKALSNCLVLFSMIAVLVIVSGILQIARGEDRSMDLFALLAPFCLIMAPLMIALAALAVLFDSIRFLRGGIGNVTFYILWVAIVTTIAINQNVHVAQDLTPIFDPFGMNYLWSEMMKGCAAAVSDYQPWQGPHSLGFHFSANGTSPNLKTFVFNGAHWSTPFLIGRLFLLSVAGVIVTFAGYAFRRFDDERTSVKQHLFKRHSISIVPDAPTGTPSISREVPRVTTLTPIISHTRHLGLTRLLVAELRIALARISRWWYIVAA
jgi:ABC-type transport system involved in multi-copper enzyme maturation permease subunit